MMTPVVSRPLSAADSPAGPGSAARWLISGAAWAALVLSALAQASAPAPAAIPVPTELDGQWIGEVRHGSDTGDVGFEFSRQADGRVLARLWLPNVNAYGSPVGWVHFQDGHFAVPESNVAFTLKEETLSGTTLLLPDISFTARRTHQLPVEAAPPAVPSGPEPAWTYRAGAALWASPVVAGGVVYIGDAGGKFHAVNATDGKPRWFCDAGSPLFGTAAVAGNAVYFTADSGHLLKVDRTTGAVLWRADIGGGGVKRSLPTPEAPEWDSLAAAPVVFGGRVFTGSADGVFRAVDEATGKILWQFKTGGKIRAAGLAAADRVYFGSMDHWVYALNCATGAELWRFDTGSPVTTAPVLAGARIVIGTRDQALLYALNADDGKKSWTVFYWLSWVESAPVLVDGLLYIGASDSRRVRVIEPDTGRVRWAAQVWGWTWGTPLVAGDTVYYGTAGAAPYFIPQQASLGALDRATGVIKWRKPLPLSPASYISGITGSLAASGDLIIAAQVDGTLVAYPAK